MATNPTLLGRLVAGRYRLQQRRGTGAHGIVVDATDVVQDRQVAIKMLRPNYVATGAAEARFRLEAQTAASMSHPNLNAVYDWGIEDIEGTKVPYLVLEHLSGGSLRDMIDRGRLLSPSQALMVGLDVCRGLDYMHRHGVVHRDLKPANLAFGDDRHVRILDVGLSRIVAEQTWVDPTAAGLDAARYASPEQARGGRPEDGTVTSATDIYALALVLIEAVTGQVPFSSDSTVATLNARIDKLMPVSADFGPLASVLSRAGTAEPTDRYTAAQFGQALVHAAENLPRPAPLDIVATGSAAEPAFGSSPIPPDPTGPMAVPAAPTPPGVATGASSPTLPTTAVPFGAAPDAPSTSGTSATSAAAAPVPQASSTFEQDVFVSRTTLPPVLSPDADPLVMPTGAVPVVPTAPDPAATTAQPAVAAGGPPAAVAPSDRRRDAVGSDDPAIDEFARRPRRRVGWLILLALLVVALVVGGFIVYGKIKDKSYTVPQLAGLEQAVAQNQIAENGWNLTVSTERSDTQPAGNVIRTDPAAGVKLAKGAAITFVVSAGPTLATLPDITGQTLDAATALLTQAKLGIAVAGQVYDETVPAGTIISWSVPAQPGLVAGAEVMPNSVVVSAVVSQGPAPRAVPNLLGMDLATATATLTNLQLTIVQDPADQFSNDEPAGTVAVQSLPTGTPIQRGESVTVALSKGQDLVAIPALGGLTFDQISAALTAAGLQVGKVTGDQVAGTIQDAKVGGVSAVPGQQYLRDTKIDLIFTTPPPPTEAPAPEVVDTTPASVG